jgi:hypothetical protein
MLADSRTANMSTPTRVKKVEKKKTFKKSNSLLKTMLKKNFSNHPLYFNQNLKEKTEERKKAEEKKTEEKKTEEKKVEEEEKKEDEILINQLLNPVRPIDEIQGKFKMLKRDTKYLVVAVEKPKILFNIKGVFINIRIPASIPSPPPMNEENFYKNIYFLNRKGKVSWVVE